MIAAAGTANGHAVGSLSSSSGTSSVRRSNQLKLQAWLPTGICVKSVLMANSYLFQESTPKFLNIEVISSQKEVSVTVDGTTVSFN